MAKARSADRQDNQAGQEAGERDDDQDNACVVVKEVTSADREAAARAAARDGFGGSGAAPHTPTSFPRASLADPFQGQAGRQTALPLGARLCDAMLFGNLSWVWHLTLGSFAFGVVFLATDPVTASATDTGRWIYGALIGALVVIIRVANVAHPDGVMFAILFGNIVAPLIDYLVMRANIRRRARRHV